MCIQVLEYKIIVMKAHKIRGLIFNYIKLYVNCVQIFAHTICY